MNHLAWLCQTVMALSVERTAEGGNGRERGGGGDGHRKGDVAERAAGPHG